MKQYFKFTLKKRLKHNLIKKFGVSEEGSNQIYETCAYYKLCNNLV